MKHLKLRYFFLGTEFAWRLAEYGQGSTGRERRMGIGRNELIYATLLGLALVVVFDMAHAVSGQAYLL